MFADARIRRSEELVNRQETGHHYLTRKVLEAIKYERDPEFVQIHQSRGRFLSSRLTGDGACQGSSLRQQGNGRTARSAEVCFDTPDGN